MREGKRILVIPDVQVKVGDDFKFLERIGRYAVDLRPDIIVQIGDFADMSSLCSHDRAGTKGLEGKRYTTDIEAAIEAMDVLTEPIRAEQKRLLASKKKMWTPEMIMCLGNHEQRIIKAINNDPKLEGLIGLHDLGYEVFGWDVYDFLEPVERCGIVFVHYLISGVMGKACTSAKAMLGKAHQSIVVGHQQGRDIAYARQANGKNMTAIIAGSCYEHDEPYLNKQSNNHWRGVYVLFDCHDGEFDELPVSLNYLERKYK